ncbi:MAG: peptidoglycan DD-metalloendopeptidase family protein [Acidobacteriota bacterium]
MRWTHLRPDAERGDDGVPRALLAALVLICVVVLPALPQTGNSDLDRIRGEITRLRRKLEDVRAQTKTAERELEEVGIELDIRTRELQIAVDLQRQIEQEQQNVAAQVGEVGQRIVRQKEFLRHRLAALYRLGGLSYLRLLMSIDERRNPIEAMSMLSYMVERDARAVTAFQNTRAQLEARTADLAHKGRRVADIRRIVEERRAAVSATFAQRERMVASLRTAGTTSARQISELEEKARRLERLLDFLSKQQAGVVATVDVRSYQGALDWPAQGKIVEQFGLQRNAKFSTVTFNNGMKIAAPPGAEVHSVFVGTVLFSQWFKGYGNLIILDHGNRVFSLYGNLKSPSVAVGDRINAGQTIAGVGESEEAKSGYLYFEIRQDNKPENPQKWLR